MSNASGSRPPTSDTPAIASDAISSITVLGEADVARAITRIAHEVIERNRGVDGVVIVGLQRGGVWIAERLAAAITRIDSAVPEIGRAHG